VNGGEGAEVCLVGWFVIYLTMLFQWIRLYSIEWRGNKWMIICKEGGRKHLWRNFKILSQHYLEELRKTTKYLSQDSRSLSWYLTLGPPDYEAGVLTTWPQCLLKSGSQNKAVLLNAMVALGGERRYSSYSFLTSALDRGWVVSVMPRLRFALGKGTPVPIIQEAGLASGQVSKSVLVI
jgi:hypothetical protein